MSEATTNRVWGLVRRRPLVVLFVLCLAAWLPGLFTLPPLDRDESRFAQASKQMLETGNFVDIRFGAEPRYKKPVGIYWLQAASTGAANLAGVARDRIWTYRIPSMAGAFAAVALVFWCAQAFMGVEGAFLSASLLGLTMLLSAEAKIAKTDAVLLATVVGSQAVLLRAYLSSRDPDGPPLSRRLALLGWAAFAIGILIKGPVIAGVCGVTVLALVLWDRQWRWLATIRPLPGVGLTLLIVLPWLVAIAWQSHGAFYEQSLGHDFGAKLAGGQETHGEPPGYYLLMTTATFWPATLFLVPAVVAAVARHREPAIRFLLAWAGANWLLFEVVPTKLPHYILPAYPALTMMVALFVLAPRDEPARGWKRYLPWIASAQFALGAVLVAAGMIVLPRLYGPGAGWSVYTSAGVVAVLALACVLLLWRGAKLPALVGAGAAALTAYAALTLIIVPTLDRLWVSPGLAAMVARHRTSDMPPPVLAGYTEPSARFLLGTATRLTDGFGAADTSAAQAGLAAIEDGQRGAFLARLAELEADATPIDALTGFNYSRGRPVHITLYRVTPPHEITSPPPE